MVYRIKCRRQVQKDQGGKVATVDGKEDVRQEQSLIANLYPGIGTPTIPGFRIAIPNHTVLRDMVKLQQVEDS